MPCQNATPAAAGMVLPIWIHAAHLAQPIKTYALIDTGAGMSAINQSFAQEIGLIRQGKEWVCTLIGEGTSYVYHADLILRVKTPAGPNNYIITTVPMLEFPHDRQYKVLIGWDTLKDGQLWANGPAGLFSLCF